MKKVLVLSLVLLIMLSGCYDRSTKVSNNNEVLISVGKEKITKQDLYEMMKEFDGGSALASLIDEKIVDAEVATTDEMEAEVDDKIATLVEEGTLEETLENYGMSEEEYREYLLKSIKAPYLYDTYISEKYAELYEEYRPFMAKIIKVAVTEGEEDAADDKINAAIEAIKGGMAFEEAAQLYSDDVDASVETFYTKNDITDTQLLKWITDGTENMSGRIIGDDSKYLYVIQLTATTATEIRESFEEYLKSNDSFNSRVLSYYAKKNNVQLYDVDYYGYFKSDYTEYISE